MIKKEKFKKIIKLASQPIKQDSRKAGKRKADSYIGKQTHQRNTGDTSGKRSGKSR
ncbi:unnamed protein product [marine sediment metagenome]|uniref:Uncharacterized protein n=1 Tax=marine sediment metagenome TaxID=412755 RepID=X1QA23_9ZZZZ